MRAGSSAVGPISPPSRRPTRRSSASRGRCRLTNEGGYIVALIAGLVIANAFPRFADWLKEAIRPELYIKIAIVLLGAFIAVTAAGKLTLASSLLLRGVAAIVEAYLIYWAVVYFIARKWFGFSREWAAPLASGISICGVAAAIATGGAIRARPQVPVLVSSLVVDLRRRRSADPAVPRANLPVAASRWSPPPGSASRSRPTARRSPPAASPSRWSSPRRRPKASHYQPGWMLAATATVKVFIDIFIGVWAFILAYIWTNHINVSRTPRRRRPSEIWQRFPKFVLGFVVDLRRRPRPGARRRRAASSPPRSAKPIRSASSSSS